MSSGSGMVGGDTSGAAADGGDDTNIEYVVVDSNAAAGGGGGGSAQTGSATDDMSGLDSSIANALISSGGKAGQQFQIVKEDSDGNQVTTTVVLVPDPSSASGSDLIAMAIEDDSEAAVAASGDVNTNTAPTYDGDVEDDGGISGIISGQGPVFITDGGGGSDVFRSADAGQYIIQEIHEEGGGDVGIHADPDYVPEEEGEVMTDDDNAPDNEPPEEQGPELLKGQKKIKMEKKCKDEDARFMKRKKILLSGIKVLEYKYLTGLKEADRKKKSIHVLNQEIKGIQARTALVEEAIKNGEANQEDSGGVIYKYEVIGS